MINKTPPNTEIAKYIEDGLKKSMEADYERLKKELVERLDYQKDIIIAGIVLNLMKSTDMQTFSDRITITIKTSSIKE